MRVIDLVSMAKDMDLLVDPDLMSARLLRIVAPAISQNLTSLFNASLLAGQFPSEWKEANTTRVPKEGDKDDVNNYWPVSVIPNIAKCFESLINDPLYKHLEFIKINCLIHHSLASDWKITLDEGKVVGTVLIDLSKAFNTINHTLLLRKLCAYGVHDVDLAWFTDYLEERKQRVVMDGVSSKWNHKDMGPLRLHSKASSPCDIHEWSISCCQ